jgi:2-desacetyl-2-hydroxyethyl bacteriochlorophyllide A dehydrogenase
MRQAILVDKRKFEVREVPEPIPNEDEVLIKVRYCGICGSDLDTYVGGVTISHGHEFSGDIVKVGSHVRGWEVGDRVTAESVISCGDCYWCARGEMGLCDNFAKTWLQRTPAFATYTKARHDQLYKIPSELSYQEAALTEPTAVALHAFRLSGMPKGATVAVLGLGYIGQIVARLARISLAGAVYATDGSKSRLELVRDIVDEIVDVNAVDPLERILHLTGGKGPDMVFECAGVVSTTQQSLMLVRKGGTVVVVGLCFDPIEILASNVVMKEIKLQGAMCFYPHEYALSLELMRKKDIEVAPLIGCEMPLNAINEAFERALNREGVKILIKP